MTWKMASATNLNENLVLQIDVTFIGTDIIPIMLQQKLSHRMEDMVDASILVYSGREDKKDESEKQERA